MAAAAPAGIYSNDKLVNEYGLPQFLSDMKKNYKGLAEIRKFAEAGDVNEAEKARDEFKENFKKRYSETCPKGF